MSTSDTRAANLDVAVLKGKTVPPFPLFSSRSPGRSLPLPSFVRPVVGSGVRTSVQDRVFPTVVSPDLRPEGLLIVGILVFCSVLNSVTNKCHFLTLPGNCVLLRSESGTGRSHLSRY